MDGEKRTLEEYLYGLGNIDADEASIIADEVREIVVGEVADILEEIFSQYEPEDEVSEVVVKALRGIPNVLRASY